MPAAAAWGHVSAVTETVATFHQSWDRLTDVLSQTAARHHVAFWKSKTYQSVRV